MPNIDYEKLEEDVDKEIDKWPLNYLRKGQPNIDFDSKTIEECKYIQTYTQYRRSYRELFYSIIFFSLGLSISLIFVPNLSKIGEYVLSLSIIGSIIGYIYTLETYQISHEIILEAEKRILSEESNPQEKEEKAVTDYDVSQPTKYVVKTTGHIRFDGDSTIESIGLNLDMTIRDSKGKIIGENGEYKFEVENHNVVAFTTQASIK